MAPQSRVKRNRGKRPTSQPSADATADDANPPPLINKPPDASRVSKDVGHAAHDPQSNETETSQVQSDVMVPDAQTLLQQTYDPDTYNPDTRMPWTPEPEPYNPESYAAWGLKHFGERWYTLRKTMLEERNIYLESDPVYKERQRKLRIIEHNAERRPFEPGPQAREMNDASWKRLWARLSTELGIEVSDDRQPSMSSPNNNERVTDLNGHDTFPLTPEFREATPLSDDLWEQFEYNRRRFKWNEERYHFEKFFFEEDVIDIVRTRHEDEPGDKLFREKKGVVDNLRYGDHPRFSIEQRRFQAHIDLPEKGWTSEQIDAEYDADISLLEWRRKNPEPKGSGVYGLDVTPEEHAAKDIWLQKLNDAKIRIYGELPPKGSAVGGLPANDEERDRMEAWRKNIHTHVSRQRQQEAVGSAASDASDTEAASNPRDSSPSKTKGVLRRARSGQIIKNRSEHAPKSSSDRGRRLSGLDVPGDPSDNTSTSPKRISKPCKTYKKERASRRLAGASPEKVGSLPEHNKVESAHDDSIREPSNIVQGSGPSSESSKLPEAPAIAGEAKPRTASKSDQAKRGRPTKPGK
ncbi:hypothetical protein F4777DRAFT_247829 [Nemania sp. FL0916]|nr:hypothetical protein F4777DRAFT_247829 [Nemania sp. FL0916]